MCDVLLAEWDDVVTEPSGTVTSPGYPEKYPSDTNIKTFISLGYSTNITITFHMFHLEVEPFCLYDFLQVSSYMCVCV